MEEKGKGENEGRGREQKRRKKYMIQFLPTNMAMQYFAVVSPT